MVDHLGGPDGFDKRKVLFIVYVVGFLAMMLVASIGGTQDVKWTIIWYSVLTAVCFGLPFIIDQLSPTSKQLDTVTWEEPPSKLQSYPVQIFMGLLLVAFTFWRAFTLNKAWINAPKFNIFSTPLGEGLLSGIAIAENWVVFGFIFPTLYVHLRRRSNNDLVAFLISAFVASLMFTSAHKLWVYANNEVAVFATFTFALVNCAFVYLFRSMLVSDCLHFANNFCIGSGIAQQVGFSIAI